MMSTLRHHFACILRTDSSESMGDLCASANVIHGKRCWRDSSTASHICAPSPGRNCRSITRSPINSAGISTNRGLTVSLLSHNLSVGVQFSRDLRPANPVHGQVVYAVRPLQHHDRRVPTDCEPVISSLK